MLPFSSKILSMLLMGGGNICIRTNKQTISINIKIVVQVSPTLMFSNLKTVDPDMNLSHVFSHTSYLLCQT